MKDDPLAGGDLSGIWRSRYHYHSDSRDRDLTGEHDMVLSRHGDRLSGASLPSEEGSKLTLNLTVDGRVVTGTWREVTAAAGHYQGATFHGAMQLVVSEDGTAMSGRWVGFDRHLAVDTDTWELVRPTRGNDQRRSTSR
ncbi:DNA-binding protein [Longispora sp. NPDC051575]|uniref:DNA-binding protein n=1 Tax=Longispora sp. NPDC051575 TaxID=3154943 RepID=UPI00341F1C4E